MHTDPGDAVGKQGAWPDGLTRGKRIAYQGERPALPAPSRTCDRNSPVTQPQRNASGDSEQEYRAIEATLLATARGRWFLAEHGRRARRVDNAVLEDALRRLTKSLREPSALAEQIKSQIDQARSLVGEVRALIETCPPRAPAELAAARPEPTVMQRILQTAEDIHELAWTLQGREGRDFDQRTFEQIARQIAAMYAMSRHQANETEHSLALIERLGAAEAQLDSLLHCLAHAGADTMQPMPED